MKIICVDNFDRDYVSDKLIAENLSEYWAELIVKMLNDKLSGDYCPDYFKAVEDNYELYIWEI